MNGAIEISYARLGLAYLGLLLPFLVLFLLSTGQLSAAVIAVLRMTLQLSLVGLYLEVLFRLDSPYLNTLWVVVMLFVSAGTIVRRTGLALRLLFLPALAAMGVAVVFADLFFLGVVVHMEHLLTARYLIPITGMLLGNCLQANIVGLDSYFRRISEERIRYQFFLCCGATRSEALRPFFRDAVRRALDPVIANVSVIGLISLPGMMTGQILGGSSPSVAIRYQIMIMVAIFFTATMGVMACIIFSRRFAFDAFDRLKPGLFRAS
ncbi:MAG: ABC transporter permease [Spirochaetales bacterium]|nr:ABC transporter permease [Leptospiraceae bacterium]MCP5483851.1 ABC transporter permease [Spirochaetales bacterium]MCP5486856.1 ABC transporter permease [Spirochaetales bacterium]